MKEKEENGSPPVTQDLDLENKILIYKVQPRSDEEIFEIIPKHIGKILTPIMGAIALTIVAFIVLFILLFTTILSGTSLLIVFSVFGTLMFLNIVYALSNWVSYMYSALIITNQRVIDVDQKHFFLRIAQETDIHTVRNIVTHYNEPFGSLLHYGCIKIERMGADPLIVYHVPLPRVIAGQIMHYHNLVVHGSIATAHNFAAQDPSDDKTPELEEMADEAKEIAKQQGIPVKG